MSQEYRPGMIAAILTRIAGQTRTAAGAALTELAAATEREAKDRLGRATHRYGTRTTATKAGPPALVSGTLRRAVTHTPATPTATGWEARVGVASGFYPPYPRTSRRTQAADYGRYLEDGDYPWLRPAAEHVAETTGAATVIRTVTAAISRG